MRAVIRLFLGAAAVLSLSAAIGCGDGSAGTTGGSAGNSGTAGATNTGGSGTGSNSGGTGTGTGTGTGGDTGPVPDPGTAMGADWTDVEPNDQPSQAVPVGIVTGSIWMGFADPPTAISS